MTVKTNSDQVTVEFKGANGKPQTLTIAVTEVTQLTDALLAARKEAYENVRAERTAAKAAAKKEREVKRAERTAKAQNKKDERIAKLEKQLAELKA